jgi:carnitine O-acetyltransferase
MARNASRTLKTSAPARSSNLPPGYVADPSAPATLRFEASLPLLPVPTLSSTGAKYLESVQPHLTPAEFAHTQSIVKSFVQSDLGKKLQERLQARAADPDVKNWLAEWWNDVAYMAYRDPVVVYVSYFYVHVDDVWRKGQVERAASLVRAVLPFRAMVESYV